MRVDYYKEFPAGAEAMAGLERAVRSGGLEPGLLELVKIRASQINGCTYCLAMHNRDARARGEHQTRLDTVAAWREAPYYTRAGAGRAGLVRGADRPAPRRCARRGLRCGRERVLPGGDRRADVRDRGDQRLEPARHRAALGGAEPGRPRPPRARRAAGRAGNGGGAVSLAGHAAASARPAPWTWMAPATGSGRLDAVEGAARLPFCLKVLLENLLRNEDGRLVTAAQVRALAGWDPAAEPSAEIAVHPGPGTDAGLHRRALPGRPGRDAGGDGRARRRPRRRSTRCARPS